MRTSKSAQKLKEAIEKAIADHQITRAEHQYIMHLALENGHVDVQEQALLAQLQQMIATKEVEMVPRI